ncbi:hypothetical protein N2152v2_004306 [Parachlorella kessleri]
MDMTAHDHTGHSGAFLQQEPEDMRLECDGTIGHVLPGAVLIMWGSWWAYNICLRYLASRRGAPYRASSWFPMAQRWLRYLEPAMKVILPPMAVSIELYFDHPDGFRYLYCPEGTKLAGRFAVTHMNNWQHTSSYPAFFLSGVVDFLGMFIHVPQGLSQAFLAVAFSAEAFLMALHKKHLPLDEMVHWLLYVTMVLCVAFILLEMRYSRSVLIGAGKAASLVFQGAWLVETAKIMMEDQPQWSMEYMGSTMMAPVAFTMIGVFTCFCFMSLYVVMVVLQEKGLLWEPSYTPLETMDPAPSDNFDDDSAQASHDGSPMARKRGTSMSPFQISHPEYRV